VAFSGQRFVEWQLEPSPAATLHNSSAPT